MANLLFASFSDRVSFLQTWTCKPHNVREPKIAQCPTLAPKISGVTPCGSPSYLHTWCADRICTRLSLNLVQLNRLPPWSNFLDRSDLRFQRARAVIGRARRPTRQIDFARELYGGFRCSSHLCRRVFRWLHIVGYVTVTVLHLRRCCQLL
jgi:hypothetical protein